jgi:hypothetical protein
MVAAVFQVKLASWATANISCVGKTANAKGGSVAL